MEQSLYERMGIDPHKSSVREIFGKIVDNDFPGSFCNVIKDPDIPGMVMTQHGDGSGSKSIQRILHAKELSDSEVLQYDVFDAFAMNAGDIACCGFVDNTYFVTQNLAINGKKVDKDEVMRHNALGWLKLKQLMKKYGFKIKHLGGETADLPDQTISYILDVTISSRTSRGNVIRGNVRPGDGIYTFASTGQAAWEESYNSGQMSNGLTLSRTGLMDTSYNKKYPYLAGYNRYNGRNKVSDRIHSINMGVSEAILSPTRQWAIIIKMIIEEAKKRKAFPLIHGICMNTGGGLTKIMHLGQRIHYRKNIPLWGNFFQFIQKETGETWYNMHKTFNCGFGLDVVGDPKNGILEDILQTVFERSQVCFWEIGDCHISEKEKNKLTITDYYGKEYEY